MSRKRNSAIALLLFLLLPLKVELIRKKTFKTREEAKQAIFEYVEIYYNRKRAHSTLDYLSPFEYERQAVQLN